MRWNRGELPSANALDVVHPARRLQGRFAKSGRLFKKGER